MSPCLTSDSPTRIAPAPHFFRRFTSAREWIPLSATRIFPVPIVDADERRGNLLRAFQFFLVVNFHQNGETGFDGERMKFRQLRVGQNCDDEQDGVRAPFDGFEDLAFINDEILAQQRQFHRRANLAEIIERALEKLFVG